jgi:hypothetical protein
MMRMINSYLFRDNLIFGEGVDNVERTVGGWMIKYMSQEQFATLLFIGLFC